MLRRSGSPKETFFDAVMGYKVAQGPDGQPRLRVNSHDNRFPTPLAAAGSDPAQQPVYVVLLEGSRMRVAEVPPGAVDPAAALGIRLGSTVLVNGVPSASLPRLQSGDVVEVLQVDVGGWPVQMPSALDVAAEGTDSGVRRMLQSLYMGTPAPAAGGPGTPEQRTAAAAAS